jgi:hypothetical protein
VDSRVLRSCFVLNQDYKFVHIIEFRDIVKHRVKNLQDVFQLQ